MGRNPGMTLEETGFRVRNMRKPIISIFMSQMVGTWKKTGNYVV